jgi:RNA ligase (TIGR02306 family)
MKGRALGVNLDVTASYDFENLKRMPDLFEDGEEVVITEKIHGTFIQVGVVPTRLADYEKYYKGRVVISSKGLGAKGVILDHNDETNLYAQAAKKHGLLDAMLEVFGRDVDQENRPIFLFGEVFGKTLGGAGVQDLTYTGEALDFRAFDLAVGNRGGEYYLSWDHFKTVCKVLGVEAAPMLYRGPYSKAVVLEHTDGNTMLSGGKSQIREGVVVKSAYESRTVLGERKIAKSVSEAYLLRKGGSEFN